MAKKIFISVILFFSIIVAFGEINYNFAKNDDQKPGTQTGTATITSEEESTPVTPITDPVKNPGEYEPGKVTGTTKITKMGAVIFSVIKTIGIIVAVIGFMIIGVKIMLGSVDEKAQYKQMLVPFLAGVFFLMLVFSIVSFIAKI